MAEIGSVFPATKGRLSIINMPVAYEGSGKGSLMIDILDSATGMLPYQDIVTLPLNGLVSTSAQVKFSGGNAVVNSAE